MHRHPVVPAPEGRASRPRTVRCLTGLALAVLVALAVSACGDGDLRGSNLPDLPRTSAAEFEARLANLDRPAVVNVWASWCMPCRSEAPLLDQAHAAYGEELAFLGVNVQDSQPAAKDFLAEFGLEFDHVFDPDRAIPAHYGGLGTPITMFFAPAGELLTVHNGVIDERTLAVNIDELRRLGD